MTYHILTVLYDRPSTETVTTCANRGDDDPRRALLRARQHSSGRPCGRRVERSRGEGGGCARRHFRLARFEWLCALPDFKHLQSDGWLSMGAVKPTPDGLPSISRCDRPISHSISRGEVEITFHPNGADDLGPVLLRPPSYKHDPGWPRTLFPRGAGGRWLCYYCTQTPLPAVALPPSWRSTPSMVGARP